MLDSRVSIPKCWVDISITHPAIFRSAVHSVVGVGTFRRAVDPEKWQESKDQVTKTPHR